MTNPQMFHVADAERSSEFEDQNLWFAPEGYLGHLIDYSESESDQFVVENLAAPGAVTGPGGARYWDVIFFNPVTGEASTMGNPVFGDNVLIDDKEWLGHLGDAISATEWSKAAWDVFDRWRNTTHGDAHQYEVVLTQTPQGYAVSCPALFGCHSQGNSKGEALRNIKEAITSWLREDASQTERRKHEMIADGVRYGYPVECATVAITVR